MRTILYIEGINPEPWRSPDLSTKRIGGKVVPVASTNLRTRNYQEGLAASIEENYPTLEPYPKGTPLMVTFLYWRRLDQYVTGSGRNQTAHRVDATNIQKATEDALQGLLFENDVDNVRVTSEMVAQAKDIEPLIIVIMGPLPIRTDWQGLVNGFGARCDKPAGTNVIVHQDYRTD